MNIYNTENSIFLLTVIPRLGKNLVLRISASNPVKFWAPNQDNEVEWWSFAVLEALPRYQSEEMKI